MVLGLVCLKLSIVYGEVRMYRLTFVYMHDDEDDDDKVLAKRFSKFLHIRPSKHP